MAAEPHVIVVVRHSGVTLAPLAGLLASSEILAGEKDAALPPFALSRVD